MRANLAPVRAVVKGGGLPLRESQSAKFPASATRNTLLLRTAMGHHHVPPFATRAQDIQPFYAVEVYRRALELADRNRTILMCVGEPDFATPARVIDAACRALRAGETHYTIPLGIPQLRRAIADHYRSRYTLNMATERVVVTVGASAAITLAIGATVNPGQELLMADPGYPSYRAALSFGGASPRLVPVGADTRYQLTADMVRAHWSPNTRGVLVASPANPTGTSIDQAELRAIHAIVQERGGVLIVDEIYHGLTYEHTPSTAAALGDDVFVVNSFSKYYCMTGWRVGWLVAPPSHLAVLERLQAHGYICPPSPSQWAAVAALEPESTVIYEAQREEFAARRNFFVPALRDLGFDIPCEPDGAFYVYANTTRWSTDSWDFSMRLLDATGIAITPGRDFGAHRANEFVRLSYTAPRSALEAGIEAMRGYLGGL